MKKVLSILVVLCMVLSMATFVSAADYSLAINNNVALMVGNNNAIAFNGIMNLPVAPIEENGVMLAPVGFVTGGFNGSVEVSDSGLVTVTIGNDRMAQMIVGYNYVVVNGQVFTTPVAPSIVDGQLMLPVTFLGETVLGKHVYYDAETKMAVVTQRKCLSSRDREVLDTIAGALTSGTLPAITIQPPVVEEVAGGIGGVNAETGKLTFTSVSADQEPEPENNGWCMVDGNLGSRWASQGAASAILDLGAVKPVTNIKVAVWKPAERNTNYSIEVSADGRSYSKVFDGASSGPTYDSYDVNDSIRYVRINTNGTSAGDWASILEVEAWNGQKVVTPTTGGAAVAGTVVAAPSGSKVSLTSSMLTASQVPEANNHAGNLIDGNIDTAWASNGDADVVIDLGSAKTVSAVGVSMKLYEDDRTIPYDIAISNDGASYNQVWTGSSDMFSGDMKYVSIGSGARYVKIIVHGNTVSGWSSVTEVEVYSSGAAAGGTTAVTTPTTTVGTETTSSATGTKIAITSSMLTASQTPEPENSAGNVIDGNPDTVWASNGVSDLVIDLGSAKDLATFGVSMKLYDDDRTIPFDVEISADGSTYTQAFTGSSEPFSGDMIFVPLTGKARYVKLVVHGNTVSGWSSVSEVHVYSK